MNRRIAALLLVALAALLFAPAAAPARDWLRDPASIEIPVAPRVAVVGDVHGAFDEFAASLECLGMAKRPIPDSFKLVWTGGRDLLVLLGDITDRGLHSREAYDAVMDLEAQAARAGGRVVALLGNHEMLLLNGQVRKWAETLKPPKKQHYQNTIDSFTRAGLKFEQAISPSGRYGAWIRRRPLFAVVNGWFFVHGGLGKEPAARAALDADYRAMVEADDWLNGAMMKQESVLWYRDWWNDAALVTRNLAALEARGVVFGHTVGALGAEGEVAAREERMVAVDVGMTPTYGKSKGGGLAIERQADGSFTFTARYPDRPAKLLFTEAARPSAMREFLKRPVPAPVPVPAR